MDAVTEDLYKAAKEAYAMICAWQVDFFEMADNPKYRPTFNEETRNLGEAIDQFEQRLKIGRHK